MRILLPPSEAKTTGGRNRALSGRAPSTRSSPTGSGPDRPDRPDRPERLEQARAQVIRALLAQLELGQGPSAKALLLPPAVIAEAVAANAAVLTSATTPALRRYTGVVYAGLGADSLTEAQLRVARRSVVIFSGLFGVVTGSEALPNYRVPAKATLPGIGVVGTFWRPVLDDVVPGMLGRHLVVDLRSGDYQAMWRPPREMSERVVTVRVLSRRPGLAPAVISYPSKYGKGLLARALIDRETDGSPVKKVEDVVAAWAASGGFEAHPGPAGGVDLVL
jgi:cytoplasmic iron level regulating protein YaaA (DUF328/UPF0246 family)